MILMCIERGGRERGREKGRREGGSKRQRQIREMEGGCRDGKPLRNRNVFCALNGFFVQIETKFRKMKHSMFRYTVKK